MSMDCPKCGEQARCRDSRRNLDGSVSRRYKCTRCPQRFSSSEVIVNKYTLRTAPCGGNGSSLAKNRDNKALAKMLAKFVAEKIEESK